VKRSFLLLASLSPVLFAASHAAADDLPNRDAYLTAPAIQTPAHRRSATNAFVASVDDKRGTPTFLWVGQEVNGTYPQASTSPEASARATLARFAPRYGLTPDALDTAEVARTLDLGRGAIVVVFRQRLGGVDVFRSDAKVILDQARRPIAIAGGLHPAARPSLASAPFALSSRASALRAIADATGVTLSENDVASGGDDQNGYERFQLTTSPKAKQSGLLFRDGIRVKRVFFPLPDRLVPAHYVEVLGGAPNAKGSDAHAYVISATDSAILFREDLVHYDAFNYRAYADASADHRPSDGPLADYSPYPGSKPNGSYPGFTSANLISIDGFNNTHDPWLPPGALESKGNNVDAYTDDDAPDGFSQGDVRAAVSSPGTFDYTFDPSQGPQSSVNQKMAALSDLFFVTNWLHDYWYDSGFDEKSGNAQSDNFNRGGKQGDPLRAEGQDGAPSTRDNSNMSTPADGVSPRMQMYVWTGPSTSTVGVQPLNQSLANGRAAFGPQSFNVTGTVVLADDAAGVVTDACEPIQNNVAGQIVLVDRGMCSFKLKAENAEAAGAIGVLLADTNPNAPPPSMSDADNQVVSIPMLSLTLNDGNALKAALMTGTVTATLSRSGSPDLDGTIDNTVIAHEWGHYLHLRHVGCGAPVCGAESEGWADFTALQMMLREGDDLTGAYAIGQYATAAFPFDPAYFGIRRYPYSTDMTKNPLTFKHIMSAEPLPVGPAVADTGIDHAEVHAAGEIWTSMLFEGLVALVTRSKGPNPPYDFEGARRRMSEYVVAGLTAAPVNPTYLEQRDALLAAAYATDKDDFLVLAQAFAKRGAGTCAVAPPRASTDFAGVVESFEAKPNAALVSLSLDDSTDSCDKDGILDGGETGKLHIRVVNNGTAALKSASIALSTKAKGLSFPGGNSIPLPDLEPFTAAEVDVDAALDVAVTDQEDLDIKATISAAAGCSGTQSLEIAPHGSADLALKSSASDGFEAGKTTWTTAGDQPKLVWSLDEIAPGSHAWRGIDLASNSDTQLVSPALEVSATDDLVMTFEHRHQFEDSMGTHWDGSVIEVSVDGKPYEDVSTYANAGYGGTIGDKANQAHNPLNARKGYIAENKSWPNRDTVKLSFKKSLAGKSIKVRFRVGTDDAAGAFGWEIDNVVFQGITNTPFSSLTANAKVCVALTADAGMDRTVQSGDTVTLDGTKTMGDGKAPLSYTWQETQGPTVTLSAADTVKPTFVAPEVKAATPLIFELAAEEAVATSKDTVTITVVPKTSPTPEPLPTVDSAVGGGCGCALPGTTESNGLQLIGVAGLLGLMASRRRRSRS
jgi:hypothetical protein